MEDSRAEQMEPALELCMKVQRKTGVNGYRKRAACRGRLLMRVVPPMFIGPRSLFAIRIGIGVFVRFKWLKLVKKLGKGE